MSNDGNPWVALEKCAAKKQRVAAHFRERAKRVERGASAARRVDELAESQAVKALEQRDGERYKMVERSAAPARKRLEKANNIAKQWRRRAFGLELSALCDVVMAGFGRGVAGAYHTRYTRRI